MQAEAARSARPSTVNALGHDEATQRRMGLAVLRDAHILASAEMGPVLHPRLYCMEAGQGGIAGHYALRLLGYLEPRPYALGEVLEVLEAGIVGAGGVPPPRPPPPKAPRRKPGPKVSRGAPSVEEVSRRRTLLAAALGKIRLALAFVPLLAGE